MRDYAQVKADGVITREVADEALSRLEVDKLGLDALDRRMLRAIIEYYNGVTAGRRIVAEYDRKFAESGTDALLTEANEKLCKMAKEESTHTLNKVLLTASEHMKNGYRLADN